MKTNKFNFSDYDEVSRDEMRDMVSTSSEPLPPIDSGSGSGSGSEAAPEVRACNGKTVGDECHFTGYNDLTYDGTCDFGAMHQYLYCHSSYGSSSGSSGSGTSGFRYPSRDVLAQSCQNKTSNETCEYAVNGKTYYGKCFLEINASHKLYCYNPIHVAVGQGSGAFSAREAACLGKYSGANCAWKYGDDILYGKCNVDISEFTSQPLICSDTPWLGKKI